MNINSEEWYYAAPWHWTQGGCEVLPVVVSTRLDFLWRGVDGFAYPSNGTAGETKLNWVHLGGVGDILAWRPEVIRSKKQVERVHDLDPTQRLALARGQL